MPSDTTLGGMSIQTFMLITMPLGAEAFLLIYACLKIVWFNIMFVKFVAVLASMFPKTQGE